jgi:protein-tyrosine phosphatase
MPLVFVPLHADKISIMISYVDHHLYIGEQMDAESPPLFISAVLWTALDLQISPPPNVVFARLPLKEYTEPDLIDLEMGVQWLARHLPEHHILVACRVGFGRSPSIIIAYLCCMHGLSFEEAQVLVTQKRPGTTPLPHLASLIEQLKSKTPALSSRTR